MAEEELARLLFNSILSSSSSMSKMEWPTRLAANGCVAFSTDSSEGFSSALAGSVSAVDSCSPVSVAFDEGSSLSTLGVIGAVCVGSSVLTRLDDVADRFAAFC